MLHEKYNCRETEGGPAKFFKNSVPHFLGRGTRFDTFIRKRQKVIHRDKSTVPYLLIVSLGK